MKISAFLIALLIPLTAFAGSVDKPNPLRCISIEAVRAEMGEQYPEAVERHLTDEEMAAFVRSIAGIGLSKVIYFELDGQDTYHIVAFRGGCVVQRGGMYKHEMHERIGRE